MQLPALIRKHRNPLAYLVLWAPFIGIYQIVNRFPLREPVELPFSAVDGLIPFIPELLPLYVAYIPLYWWTVYRSENDVQANRIFYAAYLQLLICLPFFLLVPVTMPRAGFYGARTYGWADVFWRWFDEPNNCFPSLHTSNSLLLIDFNWRRRLRWAHTAALAGVIASTTLVKQHYAVDVLGGFLVYLVSRWFLHHLEIRRRGRSNSWGLLD